jgi:hypothetical protein
MANIRIGIGAAPTENLIVLKLQLNFNDTDLALAPQHYLRDNFG